MGGTIACTWKGVQRETATAGEDTNHIGRRLCVQEEDRVEHKGGRRVRQRPSEPALAITRTCGAPGEAPVATRVLHNSGAFHLKAIASLFHKLAAAEHNQPNSSPQHLHSMPFHPEVLWAQRSSEVEDAKVSGTHPESASRH